MHYSTKTDSPYFTDTEAVVSGLGFRLVSVRFTRQKELTRIFVVIFSPEGIGIDDCAQVHRALQHRFEALLESQDVALEVSSPGAGRVLKDSLEFYAFIGESMSLWLDGADDWLVGTLKDVSQEGVSIESSEEMRCISYEDIKKAKLY